MRVQSKCRIYLAVVVEEDSLPQFPFLLLEFDPPFALYNLFMCFCIHLSCLSISCRNKKCDTSFPSLNGGCSNDVFLFFSCSSLSLRDAFWWSLCYFTLLTLPFRVDWSAQLHLLRTKHVSDTFYFVHQTHYLCLTSLTIYFLSFIACLLDTSWTTTDLLDTKWFPSDYNDLFHHRHPPMMSAIKLE